MKKNIKRLIQGLKNQDWCCTMWPDLNLKECCILHDYGCAEAYYEKSEKQRKYRDNKLKNCCNKKIPFMGDVMYIGIRSYLNIRKLFTRRPKF